VLCWVVLPLLTVAELLGVLAAVDDVDLAALEEVVPADVVPEVVVPEVVVPEVVVPEVFVLAAWVADAACWASRPNPARPATTTPPTATLIRVVSEVRGSPLLFMAQQCGSRLPATLMPAVRSL
jgi:hypothetical protein